MKNTVKYLFIVIIGFVVGFASFYAVTYFSENGVIKTIENEHRIVNVVDDGISAGIENVYNSVVVIESYVSDNLASTGSGFAFKSEKGYTYIMTNHHVIASAEKIVITLADNTELEPTLVGSDAYADIAVLKVKDNTSLPVALTGKVDEMKVGDTVFAIGSPLGKAYANTVTRGILSGKDRMVETSITSSSSTDWIMNVIQTDAAINPGNSGGPLCNASGEVIGITSLKIVESSVEGLGFAITIEDALEYSEGIIENGKIVRGYVGIEMLNATETYQLYRSGIVLDSKVEDGVVIVNVIESSPAKEAGLKKGDVVVKLNDDEITNIAELRYYLYKHKVNEVVTLSVYRNNKIEKIKIKIGEAE